MKGIVYATANAKLLPGLENVAYGDKGSIVGPSNPYDIKKIMVTFGSAMKPLAVIVGYHVELRPVGRFISNVYRFN